MLASDQKYSLKWLSSSKGNYIFFRHDIASSHVDPSVKFIMEASITENDVDRHVSNLKVNLFMLPNNQWLGTFQNCVIWTHQLSRYLTFIILELCQLVITSIYDFKTTGSFKWITYKPSLFSQKIAFHLQNNNRNSDLIYWMEWNKIWIKSLEVQFSSKIVSVDRIHFLTCLT